MAVFIFLFFTFIDIFEWEGGHKSDSVCFKKLTALQILHILQHCKIGGRWEIREVSPFTHFAGCCWCTEERRSVLALRSCKIKGISEAIWPLIMPFWQWDTGVVGLLNKDKETF